MNELLTPVNPLSFSPRGGKYNHANLLLPPWGKAGKGVYDLKKIPNLYYLHFRSCYINY
jgi:hypothetical protein